MKLDDLYRVVTEVDLPDGRQAIVRTLSDFELQARDEYALSASREMNIRLKDEEGDEYQTHIAFLDKAGDEELILVILLRQEFIYVAEEFKEHPFAFFPMPEGADLEERTEVLDKREKHEAEIKKLRKKHVKGRLKDLRKKLEKLGHDDLLREAKAKYIDLAIRNAYWDASNRATLHHAVYVDGERLFPSPQAVREANRRLLDKLYAAYREVDGVDIWELEKNASTGVSTES